MKRIPNRVVLFIVALSLFGFAVNAVEVTGRVVNDQGQPVAGVSLGTFWRSEKGSMKPYTKHVSRADGSFTIEGESLDRGAALLAIDAPQLHGALLLMTNGMATSNVVLKLERLVTVRGSYDCPQLGQPPEWCNSYLSVLPDKIRFVQDLSDPPRFSFKVPPGQYELRGYGTDVADRRQPLSLEPAQNEVDLGRINMEPWKLALHYGKSLPPWQVTEARGLPAEVTPADFKGRWVLVEFWGHW